jgi:cell division protease FtsH
MDKQTKFNIWYWIAVIFALMLIQSIFATSTQVAQIPYSQFETYLAEGKIAEVAVSDRFIQGTFKTPQGGKPMFVTTRVEPDLAQQLQEHGVVVVARSRTPSCAICCPGFSRQSSSSASGCSYCGASEAEWAAA